MLSFILIDFEIWATGLCRRGKFCRNDLALCPAGGLWGPGSVDYSMRRQAGTRIIELLEGNEGVDSLISTGIFWSIRRSEARHHGRLAISEASEDYLKGRHTISELTYHKQRCAPGGHIAVRLSTRALIV